MAKQRPIYTKAQHQIVTPAYVEKKIQMHKQDTDNQIMINEENKCCPPPLTKSLHLEGSVSFLNEETRSMPNIHVTNLTYI